LRTLKINTFVCLVDKIESTFDQKRNNQYNGNTTNRSKNDDQNIIEIIYDENQHENVDISSNSHVNNSNTTNTQIKFQDAQKETYLNSFKKKINNQKKNPVFTLCYVSCSKSTRKSH